MTSFTLVGNHQLRDLSRKLAKASDGSKLRQKFTSQLRAAARPAVEEMQHRIRTMNIKGVKGGGRKRRAQFMAVHRHRGDPGLRMTVARGVKVEMRTTGRDVVARIFVDNSHMPFSQRNLPAHLDNPRGWRHPTFGRRGAGDWAQQFGEPYFRETIRRHERRLLNAARAAVDELLEELR